MVSRNPLLKEVCVVILNWNGRAYLEKFLPFVLASTYGNMRVIVGDNASSDNSIAFIQKEFPAVEILANASNEGFAGGYNSILSKIETDYFVLLNNDVEVEPGWLEPMIDLLENDKTIGACQPKMLQYAYRNNFEYAGACGGFIDVLGYPFARGRVFDTCETDKQQYEHPIPCFWATGAALFVRAGLYKELGGLEASFFAHQEEIDFCWRMQLAGFKIYVHPGSRVYHVGGGTLPKANAKKTYLNFRNNLLMLARNLTTTQAMIILPLRFVLDAIAAWKELLAGRSSVFFAIAKAHLHFGGQLIKGNIKRSSNRKRIADLPGVYPKSIVWNYFVKGKKTFAEIISG